MGRLILPFGMIHHPQSCSKEPPSPNFAQKTSFPAGRTRRGPASSSPPPPARPGFIINWPRGICRARGQPGKGSLLLPGHRTRSKPPHGRCHVPTAGISAAKPERCPKIRSWTKSRCWGRFQMDPGGFIEGEIADFLTQLHAPHPCSDPQTERSSMSLPPQKTKITRKRPTNSALH